MNQDFCAKLVANGDGYIRSLDERVSAISIKKFLKELNSGVDHIYYQFDDASESFYIECCGATKALDNNLYLICYDFVLYELDISNAGADYETLKMELDKLDKLYEPFRHTSYVISHFEDSSSTQPTDPKDFELYLNHLKECKRRISKILLRCVKHICFSPFYVAGLVIIPYLFFLNFLFGVLSFVLFMELITLAAEEQELYIGVNNPFIAGRSIRRKIRKTKKRLAELRKNLLRANCKVDNIPSKNNTKTRSDKRKELEELRNSLVAQTNSLEDNMYAPSLSNSDNYQEVVSEDEKVIGSSHTLARRA